MPRGGKRNPPGGRPVGSTKPAEQKRDIRKLYRWTAEEYRTITEAAELEGMSEAAFVRKAAMDAAHKIVKEKEFDPMV